MAVKSSKERVRRFRARQQREKRLEATMQQLGDLFEQAFDRVDLETTRDENGRPWVKAQLSWKSEEAYQRAKAAFAAAGFDLDQVALEEVKRAFQRDQFERDQRGREHTK